MAITWYWNHIIGKMKYKHDKGYKAFHKQIMGGGNCLAILANYEEPHPMNDLKKKGWVVYGEFWNDIDHLKRCLGLMRPKYKAKWKNYEPTNIYEDVEEIKLNTYYKEYETIARAFTKAKVRVVLYYKEPKPKKGKKK